MNSAGSRSALLLVLAGLMAALGASLWTLGSNAPVKGVGQERSRGEELRQSSKPLEHLVDPGIPERAAAEIDVAARAQPDRPSKTGQETETGSVSLGLSLTVTDSARRPIEGAQVESHNGEWITDASGRAEIRVPGRAPLTLRIEVWGPGDSSPAEGNYWPVELAVALTEEKPIPSEVVVLKHPARISGTFSCSDGSSPRGADVEIFHVETLTWSTTAADEDGTFTSDPIAPGQVVLYARNGSWSDTDLKTRDVIEVIEGQVYAFHGTLAPAIDLTGRVVDMAGRPLGETAVDIYDALNPEYSESLYTQEDGSFRFEGIYPGDYRVVLPGAVEGHRETTRKIVKNEANVSMGDLVLRP